MPKIPPHAERVFKGVIFDIYQWPQTLYDGTTVTFEMARRPDTVVVIPLNGKEVFYSAQEQPNKSPYLSLFGGRVDEGEQPLAAAKRELLEESGLLSENWEEFFTWRAPGKVEWSIYYYIARGVKKVQEQQLDGGEKVEVRTCSIDEFLTKIVPHPDFYELELKNSLLSAYSPEAYEKLKEKLS